MQEKLIEKLAISIHRNSENGASVAVLKYALQIVFNFLSVALLVLLTCTITSIIWKDSTLLLKALISVIAMPLLRHFSGGIHFKSAQLCNVISALLIIAAVHASQAIENVWVIAALTAVAFILVLIYAPAGIEGLSRIDKVHYPKLKAIAAVIVAINFIIGSSLIALLFVAQALTLPFSPRTANE